MSIQDYNARLENNNTNLNEILNAINTLPTLKLQEKEVTPTTETQTIVPDETYNGLSKVVVKPMEASKYAPRFISFQSYTGDDLNQEINNLDTSNLTTMASMFYRSQKLASLDLSSWNTSNVTNTSSMFYQAMGLTKINLSNWNTSKVTNMANMFRDCNKLTELDLSSFTGENLTITMSMFDNCSTLSKIDIRNMSFDKVDTYSSMFNKVPASCLIIVKDDTAKAFVLARRSDLTNVKTIAEL